MRKKLLALFILGLLITLLVLTYRYFNKIAYFVPVPIEGYSRTKLPYIKASIDEHEYFLILDLGFSGYASINPGELSKIKNKSFEGTITSGGVRG